MSSDAEFPHRSYPVLQKPASSLRFPFTLINYFKPTRQKIILLPIFAFVYYIILQIWIAGYLYPDLNSSGGLPCYVNNEPLMTPNSTLFSEWQNARTPNCGHESKLQEIFWNTKQFLTLLLFVVVPSYLTANALLYAKEKGWKKPS